MYTNASIDALTYTFDGILQKTFTNANPVWPNLASKATGNGSFVRIPYLDTIPGMREFLGDRMYTDLSAKMSDIYFREFQGGVSVKQTEFDDMANTVGVYGPAFSALAVNATWHPDVLLWETIMKGFSYRSTTENPDGKAFFATDHPWQGSTVSNYNAALPWTADGSAFNTARQQLRNIIAYRGQDPNTADINAIQNVYMPFGEFDSLELEVLCPPSIEYSVKKVLANEKNDFGADNVYYNDASYRVSSLLPSNTWILYVKNLPIKPWVVGIREEPKLQSFTAPNDYNVQQQKLYKWSIDYRAAAGYGLWQLAVGCKSGS